MRAVLFSVLACAAISACTLPDFEVNQNALLGGAGGIDDGMSGSGGEAGSAGSSNTSGNGGSAVTPDPALGGSGGAAGAAGASPSTPVAPDGGETGNDDEPEDDPESFCIDYCSVFFQNCEENPANDYEDENDCLLTCASSGWPIGEESESPGSIRCRLTHSGFAEANPDLHCMHARSEPMPSCPP
jgi:hypothetical protein